MGLIPGYVLAVLFFVMMFGIGFILNMLMKTTWAPSVLFVLIIVPVVIWAVWNRSTTTLWEHIAGLRVLDYLSGLAGLTGAVLSGWTIRKLRLGGYKLF